MNLFGVPLEVNTRDKTAENAEMQRVIGDLMASAIEEDPQGLYRDFTQRKSVSTVDPYAEEA